MIKWARLISKISRCAYAQLPSASCHCGRGSRTNVRSEDRASTLPGPAMPGPGIPCAYRSMASRHTPARRRRSHNLILVIRHYNSRHKAWLCCLARQLAFAGLAPPQIKLPRRQAVAARCRLQPPRSVHDTKLCRRCPASVRSGLDHFQTRHLRHSRISTYATIHSSIAPSPQCGSGRMLTPPIVV